MTSLLFGTTLAALLSLTSLLTVLFRVSPLLAPVQAIPAFLMSILLTITTWGTLAFFMIWKRVSPQSIHEGPLLSIALREGVFLGLGTTAVMVFHILDLLNIWIAILIYMVFLLVELAMHH
jgi:hypothetical protein